MELEKFCSRISMLEKLTNAKKAVAILWFFDRVESGVSKTSNELARILREQHIGNPNPSALSRQIKNTKCVYSTKNTFRLKMDKKDEVFSWIKSVWQGVAVQVMAREQYLDDEIWNSTRGYIEKICVQLNGAYQYGFYDCAAVMIRRIIETLIIEAYEKLGREVEIKGEDNDYLMLGKLIEKTTASSGLSISRETKKGLKEIKKLGDLSAHNRRFNAKKNDIDRINDSLRMAFEDLANLAELYPMK